MFYQPGHPEDEEHEGAEDYEDREEEVHVVEDDDGHDEEDGEDAGGDDEVEVPVGDVSWEGWLVGGERRTMVSGQTACSGSM